MLLATHAAYTYYYWEQFKQFFYTFFSLFLSTTAVNRSHWLFDHSIALIAHGDTFSREWWAELSWAAPFNGQRSVPWAASGSASALPPGWFVCKARGSGSGSLLASVSRDWHWRQENELCRIITTKNVTPIDRGERGLGTAGQVSNCWQVPAGWVTVSPPSSLSLPPLSTPLPLRTIYRCCFCYTLAASVGARCLGSSAWPRPHVRGVRLISKNVKIANRKTVKSNKSKKKQQQQQRQRQRAKLICMHNWFSEFLCLLASVV